MSLTRCFAICLGCALAASVAGAHQGGDFIALEDYAIGHQGEGLLGTGYDVESYSGGDEISSTQSFFISPLPRIGVGVDVRFGEDANGDWVYSSVSPRLQVQLTDPHKDTRFKIGLSVGYQFAEDISVQDTLTTFEEITVYRDAPIVTATETMTTVIDTGEEETTCNPLFDLDCEPKSAKSKKTTKHSGHTTTTTTTSGGGGGGGGKSKNKVAVKERVRKTTTTTRGGGGHQGIHNHDSRQWESRMIVEAQFGKLRAVGNVIATFPEDDHAYWGYGVGVRRSFIIDELALGVEAVGDFLAGGEHELIGALHYEVSDKLTVKAGVGIGLNDASPDLTVRTGLTMKF